MAKLTATVYEKPTASEKPNPFTDAVKQYTDKGVDTAFAVEFTAEEYKAEKLLIQKAVNQHGFSAREVETDWDEGTDPEATVTSTFVIRPPRKPRGESVAQEAEEG